MKEVLTRNNNEHFSGSGKTTPLREKTNVQIHALAVYAVHIFCLLLEIGGYLRSVHPIPNGRSVQRLYLLDPGERGDPYVKKTAIKWLHLLLLYRAS